MMTFIRNNVPMDGYFEHEMVMPSAVEVEANTLGYMMNYQSSLINGIEELSEEMFYDEKHQVIFSALKELYMSKATVDIVSVAQKLFHMKKIEESGGAAYVSEIYSNVHLADDLDWHIGVIKQKYVARRLIEITHKIKKNAYHETENADELLNNAYLEFIKLSQVLIKKQSTDIRSIVDINERVVEHMMDNRSEMLGITTGIDRLDKLTLGLQPPDLIIIAGRPGMGKTALAISMLNKISEKGIPVAFFSLEMSSTQVAFRLASIMCGNSYNKIRGGFLTEHEFIRFKQVSEEIRNRNIFIDDEAGLNIFQLRTKIQRLKNLFDIKVVFIDYIQLMKGIRKSGMKREEEIASISGELKAIAKDLSIPVVGLSQLSRATEIRGGQKRPQLSDLRESGAIEQDADIVMFVYRPEYYGLSETKEGMSLDGYAEIIVEKHRNGKTGIVSCYFDKDLMQYKDGKDVDIHDFTESSTEKKSLFDDDVF